ncbi:MAG: hypothetical protein ABJP34_03535 [Erythrobacter sp.]
MNAFSSSHSSAFALHSSGHEATSLPAEMLQDRWDALHQTAAEIGAMAQLAREPLPATISAFAERFATMDVGRQMLALNGLADLEVMLKPGISALRNLHARGEDVTAAALTLWCEFHRSRQAILDLI